MLKGEFKVTNDFEKLPHQTLRRRYHLGKDSVEEISNRLALERFSSAGQAVKETGK